MIIEIPDDNSIVKWKKNDKEDWKSAELSNLIKAYEERQTGFWAEIEGGYRCSNCDDIEVYTPNFCPNCGADMRKPNCVTCGHFGKCEGCEKREEE